jgi:hypothetical protein
VPIELAVLAYSKSMGVRHTGSATAFMGCALSPTPKGWTPAPDLEAFLNAGPPPICLCFGSMQIYKHEWSVGLLKALRDLVDNSGQRVLSMGPLVPDAVRAWPKSFWIAAAPHACLFPRMACVIHHGGSGTAIAAATANVPAVVVPTLDWLDQAYFGRWIEQHSAGVHVPRGRRTYDVFHSAVHRCATDVTLKRGAERLGALCRAESNPASAVDAIDVYFRQRDMAPLVWQAHFAGRACPSKACRNPSAFYEVPKAWLPRTLRNILREVSILRQASSPRAEPARTTSLSLSQTRPREPARKAPARACPACPLPARTLPPPCGTLFGTPHV